MIGRHLYWQGIRNAVQKEVKGCDICQCTKRSTKKCGKLPGKLAEETLWNKLCIDLIGPYRIRRKGKEPIILKGLYKYRTHNQVEAMTIANLVETTWLVQYPWPVEIMYDRGGEFLDHEFKNSLIEYEYVIKTNTDTPRNPHSNAIIEIVHQVLGNLVSKYNTHKYICRWRGPMDGNPNGISLHNTIYVP